MTLLIPHRLAALSLIIAIIGINPAFPSGDPPPNPKPDKEMGKYPIPPRTVKIDEPHGPSPSLSLPVPTKKSAPSF
jgi:hypothetical protein